MMWLVRRVLAVWLILVVICIAGIAVGRLDHTPNKLQELGFGICDGEACFRGIKLGTDWRTVLKLLPEAMEHGDYLELPINSDNIRSIALNRNDGDPAVRGITVWPNDIYAPIMPSSISSNTLVARYGMPCRLYRYSVMGNPGMITLIYPTLIVQVSAIEDQRTELRLRPESPVMELQITQTKACSDPTTEDMGIWYGFMADDIYRARYLRAVGSQQP